MGDGFMHETGLVTANLGYGRIPVNDVNSTFLGLKGLSEIEKFENSCRNVSHWPRYGQMWHFLPEINFEPFTLNPFSPVKVPEMAIFEGQFYSTDCVRPTRPNFDN